MSVFLRDMMRLSERVLVMIQPSLAEFLQKASYQSLNDFAAIYWAVIRSKGTMDCKWKKRKKDVYDGWYDGQYVSAQISIVCLRGTFLVSGMTVGFLPEKVTSNELFVRVFDHYIFEVQATESSNTYITKYSYHGDRRVQYEFHFDDRTDRLTVHERHIRTKEMFELIPPSCFEAELPDTFVSSHSHWRNINDQTIEFRPIHFSDSDFLNHKPYVLTMETGYVTTTESANTQILVSRSSPFFQNLVMQYFVRLDDEPYLYMMRDDALDVIEKKIPQTDVIIHTHVSRLGIAFKYNASSNNITSREYSDMYVDKDQWLETLTGLKSGLLLSPTTATNKKREHYQSRKLIVPFGQVYAGERSFAGHQTVTIQRSSSMLFPHQYFVFILNDRLRIVQATDSPTGWLYLALLHAITSHPLPDQYTGMTGMERTFQLLNSAGCWTNQPFDSLSLNILRQITLISPKVNYYPEHLTCMLKIDWNSDCIPYSLQHFGYYLIAKKLIDTSHQLNFMHPSSFPGKMSKLKGGDEENDERSLAKLHWDYRDSYNPTARLSAEMEAEITTSSATRYQPAPQHGSTVINPEQIHLVDDMYKNEDVRLKDSWELCWFPLSRWLTDEYQLKAVWIGLLKLADSVKISAADNEEFEKELSNTPHSNWAPSEHLPWLILELEMNTTIREIQVNVARHMMQSKLSTGDTTVKNIVMQMNMGEGKTSVIIPMLALSLCSPLSSLVRVVVLRSLFSMNYQSLRFKLGGLLNRRIFPFACRRDMNFTYVQINQVFDRLKQGLRNCDVVLISPEYILSFDLLTIDKCRRNEFETGRSMLTVQRWLKTFARDVLDESDEILHVKYQLIYTVGGQQQVDGDTNSSVDHLVDRFPLNDIQLFLIVRGLLSAEVQFVAFKKRYRVNYGVSLNPRFNRLMAVPFRAKDVAADKTEFGHPDYDLPELQKTSAIVVNNLLQSENENYQSLPINATSDAILNEIVNYKSMINIILDVGALFIDGTNREIGVKWLKLSNKAPIDYAVYLESDSIFVCDRQFHHHSFLTSPASERLDRCVIYLDEVHTRGTDFKFPTGFEAAVTLGNSLTKDSFVQACMRMHKLGKGHSLTFWSSDEVHRQITTLKRGSPGQSPEVQIHNQNDPVRVKDILRWVYENSQQATWDGLHHWAAQSLSFQRKVDTFWSIHWTDHQQVFTDKMMEELARECLEPEIIELKRMYGAPRVLQTISEIYVIRYQHCSIRSSADTHDAVLKRLSAYGGSKQRLSQLLDEEQQRELEQELEEERQVARPPPVRPRQPILHKAIKRLCNTDGPMLNLGQFTSVFRPLVYAFTGTTFSQDCSVNSWQPHFSVSTEFQRVILAKGESLDPFLRPPRWIMVYRRQHIILSALLKPIGC
ncbi:unnamed protein product [Didymodactylos carnosus]|uniref:ubiquitinyl hydrolase 1 n=1 Tax=Didymodactylos carnosus TaxID=1234261 RepID=A0A814NHZ9_9BILA|nr:unnamed protein product [Didymodactylos carnosus]CAF3857303.1 unnamed protein product [Didymodactylos carnosus]